jgi:hypothetical protein
MADTAPSGVAMSRERIMFAYFGLGPQEMILLALMALVMVVGPIIAVFLGLLP